MRDGGGFLTEDDFAAHTTAPIRLVATTFRGSTVWELSPPTQGVSVIHALEAIQREFDVVESPEHWLRVIELMGEAMAAAGFDLRQIGARPAPGQGDTTYIAAVDHQDGGASLITSLFGDFGAHSAFPSWADRSATGRRCCGPCGCR